MKTIKKIKEFFHTTYESEPLRVPPKTWFYTFMCMNIPIAGWVYLLRLARQKEDNQLKDFAQAYLFYKLIFLLISLVILIILLIVGVHMGYRLLSYMGDAVNTKRL